MKRVSSLKNPGSLGQIVWMSVLVSMLGLLLLWAVSFIPTALIQDHALAAAYQIENEGWPRDYSTFTGRTPFDRGLAPDSVSVMTAYTLDRQHPENLFLKKVNDDPNILGWYRRLVDTVEGRETVTSSYSRYWMGFRLPIRLLLVVTGFYGMRIIAMGLMMLLLVIAAGTTAQRSSTWVALALAGSIGLIEPWAIAGTLSFSTCTLLLLLLIVVLNCAKLSLSDGRSFQLFCLFGALTQFFDFYTFPLLVYALPALVLLARYEGEGRLKHSFRLFLGWLLSWLLTWVINIALVSVFTEDNGIRDAWQSVAFRFGIGGYRAATTSYSVPDALRAVWDYVGLPSPALVLPCLCAVLIGLYVFARLRFGKSGRLPAYLAVGALGVVWIAATAQPVLIHTSMQYRSICTVYFALMLYALDALGILSRENRLTAKLWKP